MDKLTVVRPYSGIFLINRRELTVHTYNLAHSQRNFAELEKPISEGFILYESMDIPFLKR